MRMPFARSITRAPLERDSSWSTFSFSRCASRWRRSATSIAPWTDSGSIDST